MLKKVLICTLIILVLSAIFVYPYFSMNPKIHKHFPMGSTYFADGHSETTWTCCTCGKHIGTETK